MITHDQLDNILNKSHSLIDADGDNWFPEAFGDYDLNGDICVLHSPSSGDMKVDVNSIDLVGGSLVVNCTIFHDNGEEETFDGFTLTPLRAMSVSEILTC